MERYIVFIDEMNQNCKDDSYSQLDLLIQYNPKRNPGRLFCEYQQIDSKVDMKRKKI